MLLEIRHMLSDVRAGVAPQRHSQQSVEVADFEWLHSTVRFQIVDDLGGDGPEKVGVEAVPVAFGFQRWGNEIAGDDVQVSSKTMKRIIFSFNFSLEPSHLSIDG